MAPTTVTEGGLGAVTAFAELWLKEWGDERRWEGRGGEGRSGEERGGEGRSEEERGRKEDFLFSRMQGLAWSLIRRFVISSECLWY